MRKRVLHRLVPFLVAGPMLLGALSPVRMDAEPGLIYSSKTGCRDIALTYDAEFGKTTHALIDTIDQLGIRTTWFLEGDLVDRYPETVEQIAAHHEIGNHTLNHLELPTLSESEIHWQFARSQERIEAIAGVNPQPIWRPPYGEHNSKVVQTAAEEGYPYTILWSVDPADWDGPSAETIRRRVVDGAFPGAIVLQHGFPPNTVEATRMEVEDLRAQGYQFLTVTELLGMGRDQRDFGGDTYVVQPGDTAGQVGACHNITGGRLEAYNDVSVLRRGQVLSIPHRDEILVRLNGQRLTFPVYPRLSGERSLIHVRMAQALGAKVSWEAGRVIVQKAAVRIELTPGSQEALVNGVVTEMGAIAVMDHDRVLVPVRFLAERLGAHVTWDSDTWTVNISTR